jgi:hypothetical protein
MVLDIRIYYLVYFVVICCWLKYTRVVELEEEQKKIAFSFL